MNCLSRFELEKTLEEVEGAIPDQWEEHIADCEVCRNRLEEFAGSLDEWQSACRVLTDLEDDADVVRCEEDDTQDHALSSSAKQEKYRSTIFYRLDWSTVPDESGPVHADYSTDLKAENFHVGVDLDAPAHPENLGRVGRYEIERTIGRGGMGIVFKGFDAELNRPVAIKILSPHLAGHGTARQRFTREAKAAAAVVHDNVVPIFDIHAETKQPYLVMPFVNGLSLQDYVDNKGQLGTRNILQVALQIASGLSAAHAQGLIHRDIKPANVLLENGLNRVQITDFGLARAVDDAAMTHSGMIAGTPHYMSPEQAKGESLDHRSDLFSLGCVMYFMATGRTLHRGQGPFSVISQLCRGKYTPVREINPKIPGFVADIIDKLLEKEPQHRFQTASQLAQHLEKSLAYLQQPTGQKAPRTIWSSRKKKLYRGVTTVVGGSLGLLAFIILGLPLLFPQNLPPASGSPGEPSNSEMQLPFSLTPLPEIERELNNVEISLDTLERQLVGNGTRSGSIGGNLQNELWELEGQLAPRLFPENGANTDTYQNQPFTDQAFQNQSNSSSGIVPGDQHGQPGFDLRSGRFDTTNRGSQQQISNDKQFNDNGSILNPNNRNPNEENEDNP